MAELIDKGALIDHMKSQWDMQDLYMPVHFEYLVDEIPITTEAEIRAKAISEILEIVNRAYHNFCGYDLAFMQKYGNTTAAQRYESYSTMMMYEIANEFDNLIDEIAEKLKEKLG